MRAFAVINKSEVSKGSCSISRNQLSLLGTPFFCRTKCADSGTDTLFNSRGTHTNPVAVEKEAKAVLGLFLRKQGFSNAVALKTISRSNLFVDHLVSRLHSMDESQYIIGKELATVTEIRDALTTYLETLLKKHGNMLIGLVENFPNPPAIENPDILVSPPCSTRYFEKQKAVSRVSEVGPAGKLRPSTLYLIELGMDLEQIKRMAFKFPRFSYCSLEGKIKPLVEFLLNLGVSKSDIGSTLTKLPQLCALSFKENIIPSMTFLENLGLDKRKWAKVLCRYPQILSCRKEKIKMTIDFLFEMGLSAESVGRILTRQPSTVGFNVEHTLRPTAEYFRSLGVDVAALLHRFPQCFGLGVDTHLKPVTEFFLERGYTIEEVGVIISKFGCLYALSLKDSLIPKWEFFLTMDYPKQVLISFPRYFSYSLEGRIKPRYALVKESKVKFGLNQMLALSNHDFNKALKKKMGKKSSGKTSGDTGSSDDLRL